MPSVPSTPSSCTSTRPTPPRSESELTPERRHLKVLEALDVAKTQYYHFTAVVIAGMGFFTDSYDLFCIGVVTKLLGRLYYQDPRSPHELGVLPIGVTAAVNGTALVGTLIGQIVFGWLGDKLGRKKAYGITLSIMIICSIASGLSFGSTANAVITTLCFFRFWLGFGIGGDYPLSATIMSEYANTKTRGAFIAAVFAMQGLGILIGGIVGLILSLIFKKYYPSPAFQVGTSTFNSGDNGTQASTPHAADFLWRVMFILGALPAAFTLYYRLRMPETARYTALVQWDARKAILDMTKVLNIPESELGETAITIIGPRPGMRSYYEYGIFSKEFMRRHGVHLLGTSTTWFLLDVAFYSQNLFQNHIFTAIHWLPKAESMSGIYEVYRIARAQCIVAACATIPGYWVSMFLIDWLGRFIIQLQGFLFMSAFLFAIAGFYGTLSNGKGSNVTIFLVLYSFTFFFANFGPNTTTFVIPAELFPTRFRATCHGISAGSGKIGAIVGTFGFLYASQSKQASAPYPPGIGMQNTLFMLAATCLLGAFFTFLIPETKGKSLEDITGERYIQTVDSPGDAQPNLQPKNTFHSEGPMRIHYSKNDFSLEVPASSLQPKRLSTASSGSTRGNISDHYI